MSHHTKVSGLPKINEMQTILLLLNTPVLFLPTCQNSCCEKAMLWVMILVLGYCFIHSWIMDHFFNACFILFYFFCLSPAESSSSSRPLGSFCSSGRSQLCQHSHDETTVSPSATKKPINMKIYMLRQLLLCNVLILFSRCADIRVPFSEQTFREAPITAHLLRLQC